MNFKDWQVNVVFDKVEFESELDEREDRSLMEESLLMMITRFDFMPRMGDCICDVKGKNEPFTIEEVIFHSHSKTIEFVLSFDD